VGVDIHACAERRDGKRWIGIDTIQPFEWTRVSKSCYAFLADVRNHWGLTPISRPRGLPSDSSDMARELYGDTGLDAHTASWLMITELDQFDYDATVQDKARTVEIDGHLYYDLGGQLMDAEPARTKTYRQFLGEEFLAEVRRLKAMNAERIVFWCDN
jgi:hypothetical protein